MFDRLLSDEKAAIAAFFAKGGKVNRITPKIVKVPARVAGPVAISRVAAKPVTMKLTQGFAFVSLSDRNSRR